MSAERCYQIEQGDDVYVDCSAYGVEGYHWCRVTHIAPGSASIYPIKFKVPERGIGQCKASEVIGIRTPDWLVDVRAEMRRAEMVRNLAEGHGVIRPITYRVVPAEDGAEAAERAAQTIAEAEQYIADQRA